jgi:hypothetical protein
MENVLKDGEFVERRCCIHTDQKLKMHKHTETNFYALCPICNPIFDEDEMHMYDCFCATCKEYIFAIDEPTLCFMCNRLACDFCTYVSDEYIEPICSVCRRKINTAEFDDEYHEKLQAERAAREARRKARREQRKANRK